jgi:hypothetical protein
MDTSDDELRRADANLLASIRAPARWQGGGAVACEDGGLLLVAGVRRFAGGYSNCAARLDRALPAAEALARAAAFFAARDRGFSWFLRDPVDGDLVAATAAAGLASLATMPWMIRAQPLPDEAPPPGVSLRWGDDARVRDDAVAVCAEAYVSLGLPGPIVRSIFGNAAARGDDGTRVVVAYADGVAASTARLLSTDGVAGIYWVATRPAQRGRRLAEACTRAVTNAGLAQGARFAVLQASHLGAPVYTRLGFVTRWQCRWVIVTRDQARALAQGK